MQDFINDFRNPKPEAKNPTPDITAATATTEKPVEPGATAVSANDLLNTGNIANVSAGSAASATPATSVPTPVNTTNVNTGKVISIGGLVAGDTATDLMDTLLPSLIVSLLSFMGYHLDKKGLGLTAKEKEVIAPFMQQALNAMQFDLKNPFYNLLFVLAAIYGTKVIAELPKITKAGVKKPVANLAEVAVNAVATIAEKDAKEKQVEDERKKFIGVVKQMHYQTAIKYIKDQRKMSSEKAINWYNKFVKHAA